MSRRLLAKGHFSCNISYIIIIIIAIGSWSYYPIFRYMYMLTCLLIIIIIVYNYYCTVSTESDCTGFKIILNKYLL